MYNLQIDIKYIIRIFAYINLIFFVSPLLYLYINNIIIDSYIRENCNILIKSNNHKLTFYPNTFLWFTVDTPIH